MTGKKKILLIVDYPASWCCIYWNRFCIDSIVQQTIHRLRRLPEDGDTEQEKKTGNGGR